MMTVDLSEYRNYAIQNPILEEVEFEEEGKGEDSIIQSHKEREPGRISCTHRALAQHFRS
jgi:hypothetical protein